MKIQRHFVNKEIVPPVRKSNEFNWEDKEKSEDFPALFTKNTYGHSEQTGEDERKPDSVVA